VIYRIGTYIPILDIDIVALAETFKAQPRASSACSTCSPAGPSSAWRSLHSTHTYISALIIIQLDKPGADPGCARNEGRQGRKQIDEYVISRWCWQRPKHTDARALMG
jgi:preprotein translocase subunit SecY